MGERHATLEGLDVTPEFWRGKRVFLTGHTGFKGAWAAAWLSELGAEVTGYSLEPEGEPNLWTLLGLNGVASIYGDICDRVALDAALAEAKPDVVLHLAAQSLVRRSYRTPVDTFRTNVIGVVELLDAVRALPSVKAVVIATSDKAYDNVEQIWGYRESDPMGGRDPYSASKGAAEIATAAMRMSFFETGGVASVRAGNVIGGGDWSEDRLVPDIVRGCLGEMGAVTIRAPHSIRPWQHVLEPLRGYFMVAEALHEGREGADAGWNFGPERVDERAVIEVAEAIVASLGKGRIDVDPDAATLHEAKLLRLDCSKARLELGWSPVMTFDDCIRLTADWYGGWSKGEDPGALTRAQISEYMRLM